MIATHTFCGRPFDVHPRVAEFIEAHMWSGGLDCPFCNLYRPLAEFDLSESAVLGKGGEVRQDDVHEGDSVPAVQTVTDLPPSRRGRPPKETAAVEHGDQG